MTSSNGSEPYRTVDDAAVVTTSGTSAAATARIAVDETHFDSQIEPRETGLEATQARVPVSRSWTMRLTDREDRGDDEDLRRDRGSRLSPDPARHRDCPASSGSGTVART